MDDPKRDTPPVPARLAGWLAHAAEAGASDLHLVAGHPPVLRLHGDLTELREPPLDAGELSPLLAELCPPDLLARLRERKSVDYSFDLSANGQPRRFRANLFHAGGQLAACVRVVPAEIPSFEWAGLPVELAERLAFLRDGLVFVTGATGSGKTTTLAMIVNLINQTGGYRIITAEEPGESLFPTSADSVVSQSGIVPDLPTSPEPP